MILWIKKSWGRRVSGPAEKSGMNMKIPKYLLVLLVSWEASANFVGNDTSNFNPISNGLGFVTVHDSSTLDPGVLNSGIFFNYAGNVLPATMDYGGNRIGSNNNKIVFTDLNLGFGLYKNWDAGINISYLLSQETERAAGGAQFSGVGLNEIRFSTKYRLIERKPLGMAVIFSSNLNQAQNNPWAGRGAGPTYNLELATDYQMGAVLLGANFGYRKRSEGQKIDGAVYEPLKDQMIGSLAASYYAPSLDTKFITEIIASKPMTSVKYVESSQISSEFLVGVKWDITTNLAMHIGGGTRIGEGLFTPDWRIYSGVNFALDILDFGTDEVPVAVEKITHRKGYMPEDIEALRKNDFDEIAKYHEFHLRKTVPDADYHGEKPPFEIIRLDNFSFDTAKADIKPEHREMLDRLALYVGSQPQVLKIRVEGHTDSIGAFDRNKRLSQRRADALKKYLLGKGIKDLEIEAAGYGAERPIADNGNFQSREQNRRVEIRILRQLPPVPETIHINP